MVLTLQNAIIYIFLALLNAINYSLFYNFTVVLSHFKVYIIKYRLRLIDAAYYYMIEKKGLPQRSILAV